MHEYLRQAKRLGTASGQLSKTLLT